MYRQGTIKLVVNADADGTAEAFVAAHGPAASVRQGVVYRRCRSGPQSRLTWRPSWRWRRVGLRNFRYGNRGAGGCLICVVDEGPRVSSYRVDFIIKADVTSLRRRMPLSSNPII